MPAYKDGRAARPHAEHVAQAFHQAQGFKRGLNFTRGNVRHSREQAKGHKKRTIRPTKAEPARGFPSNTRQTPEYVSQFHDRYDDSDQSQAAKDYRAKRDSVRAMIKPALLSDFPRGTLHGQTYQRAERKRQLAQYVVDLARAELQAEANGDDVWDPNSFAERPAIPSWAALDLQPGETQPSPNLLMRLFGKTTSGNNAQTKSDAWRDMQSLLQSAKQALQAEPGQPDSLFVDAVMRAMRAKDKGPGFR
jgi:hypothetical protein